MIDTRTNREKEVAERFALILTKKDAEIVKLKEIIDDLKLQLTESENRL